MTYREFNAGHKTHYLKCDPTPFDDLRAGIKQFEVRRDDREYRVGDTLVLRKYCRECRDYKQDRELTFRVRYVLRGFEGIAPGFVVMGLAVQP